MFLMLCVIAAVTAKINGIDVITGNAYETNETRVSGMGYTTRNTIVNAHKPINENAPTLVRMLRVIVCLINDGSKTTKNGASKRRRTAIGVVSSFRNITNMIPSGMTASTTITVTMQNVMTQVIGRTNLMVYEFAATESAPTSELTRRREPKRPPPQQISYETRSRRSRPTKCSASHPSVFFAQFYDGSDSRD